MTSKRFHTKSRRGCVQCKQRRVKCDERHPGCHRCDIRGETCSYSLDGGTDENLPSKDADAVSSTHSASTDSTICSSRSSQTTYSTETSVVGSPWVPVTDLAFMIHFVNETGPSLAFGVDGLKCWQSYIPQLAIEHVFVLHAIVATSALHQAADASLDPLSRDQFLEIARMRRIAALDLFIPALSRPSRELCDALITCNMLLSVMEFGWQSLDDGRVRKGGADESAATPTRITAFIRALKFCRGIALIQEDIGQWLFHGPLYCIWRQPDLDSLPDLSPNASRAFQNLVAQTDALRERSVSTGDLELQADVTAYKFELPRLHKVCKCMYEEDWQAHCLEWPVHMDARFDNMLQRGDQLALSMLAFWASCVSALSHRWWARPWSFSVLQEVQLQLPGVEIGFV